MAVEPCLKDIAGLVDVQIEKFFPKKIGKDWLDFALGPAKFHADEKTANAAVAEPIWDFLSRGGKRWRPALMFLSCGAAGGDPKSIEEFAVLPELVHNGTIMVDDVEDCAELRRGKPCTHKIYGADLAINDANLLYFLPTVLLYRNTKNLGDKMRVKIYDVYSEEMLRLSFGQAMDIYWHNGKGGEISEKQYLQMCHYKTGTLASFAAKLGAILAGADGKKVQALGDFAATIGTGFQIQDDILNLFPSKGWGKETGEDIAEGKRSLLAIHALAHAPKAESARLLEILNSRQNTKDEIKGAIKIIKTQGSADYARKTAADLVSDAWNRLNPVIDESESKAKLKEFADYLINRKL